ncbi:hypothetical protein PFWH6_4326 [Pseudomonas fluorescens WH6]|nr:hypothetical protein PFWH6_4326 [Pseudomonas fluorescens WH6]
MPPYAAIRNDKISEQNSISSTTLLTAIFLFLLLLISALTFSISPMNGEDYALSRIFENVSLFDRFDWALGKSTHQIQHWNARFGEQLSIFWLAMPKAWFSIATILFISLFTFLLALISTPQEKWNTESLVLSSMLAIATCFLLWPRLEMFFWQTATAGYLQPMALTLILILPFHSSGVCKRLLSSWSGTLAFVVLALICGVSFENVPPSLIPYMVCVAYTNHKKDKTFSLKISLIILAYLISWTCLMLAPSTKFRTAYYIEALHIPAPSLNYYFWQAIAIIQAFFSSSAKLLITLIAILAFATYLKIKIWNQPIKFYLLLIPAALCVASVIKAPYIEPRAFFLTWVILIIFIVRCFYEVVATISNRSAVIAIVGLGLASIGMGAQVFSEYLEYARKVSLRAEFIMTNQGTHECQEGLSIELIPVRNDIRILNNREEWVASSLTQVSKYFNCQLVITTNAPSEPK